MDRSPKILVFSALFFSIFSTALIGQARNAQPREEKLLNGMKIQMWPDASARDVAIRIRIHSGSAFDPQGKEGVMKLLAENIFPNEAAREYFRDDLGGSLEIISNYDHIQINASSTPENSLQMLETLGSALTNVPIDKETTAKLRAALLASVKALENDPSYVADRAAAARLFGTFPYGRPENGSSTSIAKIDFADLIDAKLRFLTADNATVAIIGNFDKTATFRAVRRYFGAWLKSDRRVPSTFRQPDAPPAGLLTAASPKPDVAAIRYVFRGAARSGKDMPYAEIFASVMETRLRSRVPSVYSESVFVRNEPHVLPGSIAFGFSAATNDIGPGNGKIDAGDLMIKLLADPITEPEFNAAKAGVVGRWNKQPVADLWLDADTFKTAGASAELDAIQAATLADTRAFAARIAGSPAASVLVNSPSK